MNALLCVALLVPGYGEKDIIERIEKAGGTVSSSRDVVVMAQTTTDADFADFDDFCELRHLTYLDLTRTKVTDKSMRAVSDLRGLRWLDITGTGITDTGLRHLESLSTLESINFSFCPKITDAGVSRLRKALARDPPLTPPGNASAT